MASCISLPFGISIIVVVKKRANGRSHALPPYIDQGERTEVRGHFQAKE